MNISTSNSSVISSNRKFAFQTGLKTILCVLPKVTGGGAERFLITFLKHIDRNQYNLAVVLARRDGGFDHEIPNDIPVYVLFERDSSTKYLAPTGPFRYVPALKNVIKEINPDAIISFGSLLNGAVALAGKIANFKNPIILIEAIHESSEMAQHSAIEKLSRSQFLRWTYKMASAVVAVSDDIAVDLRNNFDISENIHVIHYGISLENVRNLSQKPVNHPWLHPERKHKVIVACGRLVKQKGFNILIEAIHKLSSEIKLILVGDGDEKDNLTQKIRDLNLQQRVDLVGYDRNPYRYIVASDAFVMPSLWEGLPIVLLEALSLGVPIIASDCPTGPKEILNHGECGVLVEPNNSQLLAREIEKLIFNPDLGQELSKRAIANSEKFAAEKSTNNYLNLIANLGGW
ncbi:MAG: glycosyltransferase [Calothrix sp. CSU_2_0]|nr:glycosyltransferase [Calothrix sp. CSU_2_0]